MEGFAPDIHGYLGPELEQEHFLTPYSHSTLLTPAVSLAVCLFFRLIVERAAELGVSLRRSLRVWQCRYAMATQHDVPAFICMQLKRKIYEIRNTRHTRSCMCALCMLAVKGDRR
jgi:hypothetical protein